jgi:4-diphosphocytidyl-2-C-methyl-D-erythritol kinase
MYLHRDELKCTARAPAKLNLYLEVHQRRDDGFHEIATLVVPIRLADDLTLTATSSPAGRERGTIVLDVRDYRAQDSGKRDIPIPVADNLVLRALELLQQRSGSRYGARVELVKRIPLAAGLGGGSSDAAAALRLANRAWGLNWSMDRLAKLAAEIGSDVPFFLAPGAAICRGRGERIERLPAMRPLHFIIVKPPLSLSTADVYQARDTLVKTSSIQHPTSNIQHPASSIPAAELAAGRWTNLRALVFNRLQAAAATLTDWIEEISGTFDRLDVVAHQLSGSGSAYFGVCRHRQHARRLASILRTRQLGLVYATSSCQ